jgi:hypothetical protein
MTYKQYIYIPVEVEIYQLEKGREWKRRREERKGEIRGENKNGREGERRREKERDENILYVLR